MRPRISRATAAPAMGACDRGTPPGHHSCGSIDGAIDQFRCLLARSEIAFGGSVVSIELHSMARKLVQTFTRPIGIRGKAMLDAGRAVPCVFGTETKYLFHLLLSPLPALISEASVISYAGAQPIAYKMSRTDGVYN